MTKTFITITEKETGFTTPYMIKNGSIRQFTFSNISIEEQYVVKVIMANAIGNSSAGEMVLIARLPEEDPTTATTENSYLTSSETGIAIK